MLGSLAASQPPAGVETIGTDLDDTDLTDADQVAYLFERSGPFDAVLHTAAYTDVDLAEEREEEAFEANATATRLVAEACAAANIPLVAVSTDFVFGGIASRPYREDDRPEPTGAYGRTKLAGERAALEVHARGSRIVRTQWLYGPGGVHFPARILQLATERPTLKVVNDQTGCPTSTLELAPALWDVLFLARPGVYHAACEGSCTWYELAVATLEMAGVRDVEVWPCSTDEFPRPASRPVYSVLDCSRLADLRGQRLAHWRVALRHYLESRNEVPS